MVKMADTTDRTPADEPSVEESRIIDNVWGALGISTFEQAQGKDIATHVSEIRLQLVAAEARVAHLTKQDLP